MANTGLLVLSNPAKVRKLLPVIGEHVLKTLYIQYFPEKNGLLPGNYSLSASRWKSPCYAQTVANIYAIASTIPATSRLDVRVLLSNMKNSSVSVINTKRPVELVIFDQQYTTKDANTFMQDCLANTSMGCKFMTIDQDKYTETETAGKSAETEAAEDEAAKVYNNVVLGGTFDRLHNGHKILLNEALLRCTKKLTVGVTDENMLTAKVLWELIEPCSKRISDMRDYLEDVDASVKYDIVPIKDMYGPTRNDPTFELLVVSEETAKGGDKVNELRKENGLNELDIHVVKLVQDSNRSDHEEAKISSCNQRIRLLGSRLKKPSAHPGNRPYIIGLTGGIGSGKSSIAEKLGKLGAGVIQCDKLAHELYEPGERCNDIIYRLFGERVLWSDGVVNREALGDIVFNDKAQMEKLNKAIWPEIRDAAMDRINKLYRVDGYQIIVLEAAVLIQAQWQFFCHEIWTCIIPYEEAVKRVMARNFINEQKAIARIEAQPTNPEQVREATVVFCTLWSHDVTQQQVEKAWNELKKHMEDGEKDDYYS